MSLQIAVPVIGPSTAQVQDQMNQAAKVADIIEIRADKFDQRYPDLSHLMRTSKKPTIVTIRHPDESGETDCTKTYSGDEADREQLYNRAILAGATFIDRELKYPINVAKRGTNLILSNHDYNQTPCAEVLQKRYNQAVSQGADIVKFATKANSIEDVITMLDFLRKAKRRVIGVNMSDENAFLQSTDYNTLADYISQEGFPQIVDNLEQLGQHNLTLGGISRILSPIFGSYLTFGSINKATQSAPGQLDPEEIRNAYNLLLKQ